MRHNASIGKFYNKKLLHTVFKIGYDPDLQRIDLVATTSDFPLERLQGQKESTLVSTEFNTINSPKIRSYRVSQ